MKSKTAKGTMITGTVSIAMRPINLFASFLLLRWLRPEDFGAVALAMLLFQTSNIFTSLGMDAALIHTKMDKHKAAFHVFVAMMAGSFVFFSLVFFNVSSIASLLTKPENVQSLIPILQWLSTLIILMTASTVPNALLRKNLQFGRLSMLTMISQVVYVIVALVMAVMGYGVWSLVFARIISTAIKTCLSFFVVDSWEWLKPRRWEPQVISSLFKYGRHSMMNGVVSYTHSHWDDWLVGRVLGEAALGFYQKSYDLTNNTIKQFSDNVIGSVFFPTYTKMQNNLPRLLRAYLKSVGLVGIIVAPMAFGLLIISRELVSVLWGSTWAPMIPLLQIYAFMLLSRPISTNTVPLFLALGKPNYNSRAGYVLLAVMVTLALSLLSYGIMGVATAVVVSHFVGAAFNIYQVNTLLPRSWNQTFRAILPSYLAGFVMAGTLLVVKAPLWNALERFSGFIGLGALIAVGGLIYLPIILILQRSLFVEMWRIVAPMLEKQVPFMRRTAVSKTKLNI